MTTKIQNTIGKAGKDLGFAEELKKAAAKALDKPVDSPEMSKLLAKFAFNASELKSLKIQSGRGFQTTTLLTTLTVTSAACLTTTTTTTTGGVQANRNLGSNI